MRNLGTISGHCIDEQDDGSVIFTAGATLDGDGANGQFGGPPCYAPASYQGPTLDALANAGSPGNWYGVVTDTNFSTGDPLIQQACDPCPGAYISATSLHLYDANGCRLPDSSPFKYVDSATVPFIVTPPLIIHSVEGIVLGCRCVVTNAVNSQSVEAVVADIGPRKHLGEISLACAKAIGIPCGGRHPANSGGVDGATIIYRLYPGVPAAVNGVNYPLQSSCTATHSLAGWHASS